MTDLEIYKESQIVASGKDEERLIADAISILRSMGMLDKYDEDQQRGFIRSCMAYGLNPILKEIYPMPFYNAETKKYNLGVCPDYKTFLNRAEKSGNWDGYEVNFDGEVKFRTVDKEIKKKDGGTFKKSVKVVDPLSSLSGTITIWRKDWSRPFKSRPLMLVQVMKDTDFWHGDPYGMLEKQLIRTFFPKAFPKDCALRDDSIEADHSPVAPETPEYEVIETKPIIDKAELALALKDAKQALYDVPMASSEADTFKAAIDQLFKDQNIDGLKDIARQLRERLESMKAAKAQEIQQENPANAAEEKAKTMIKEVLDKLIANGKSRVYVRNSLKKHLAIESDLDSDWTALLWAAPFDLDQYREAYKHWKAELDTAPSKKRKEAIKLAKANPESEELLTMIEESSEEELDAIIDNLAGGKDEE